MLLFDFIPLVFKKEKWKEVSDKEKAAHFFMLQRFSSIKYPVQANLFNNLRINPSDVVNCWHELYSSKYTQMPHWFYAKTNKSKKTKESKSALLDSTIKFYIEDRKLSMKEFKQMQTFFGEELEKELLALQKVLKQQDVIK